MPDLEKLHEAVIEGNWKAAAAATHAAIAEGVQRAEFFTSRPDLEPRVKTDDYGCEAELGWKHFTNVRWTGDVPLGGMTLGDAYRAVAMLGGLADAQIVINTGDFALPAQRMDGEPLFLFNPGQPLSEILAYLRDNWGGFDELYFGRDGKFYADAWTWEASGSTFGLTRPTQTIEELKNKTETDPYIHRDGWRQTMNENGFANEVHVAGQDLSGFPIIVTAIDWPSIKGNTDGTYPDNYVGEHRRLLLLDAGLITQAMVNTTCANIYERVRVLRPTATATGTFVSSLWEGDIIAVHTKGYWRITGMHTTWNRTWSAGLTRYELEFLPESEVSS